MLYVPTLFDVEYEFQLIMPVSATGDNAVLSGVKRVILVLSGEMKYSTYEHH